MNRTNGWQAPRGRRVASDLVGVDFRIGVKRYDLKRPPETHLEMMDPSGDANV